MVDTRANGIYDIRKRYVNLNLSSSVVDLVMNSWSKGTQKQHSTHINRWFDYCARHNIDPFESEMSVECLTKKHH